MTDRIDDDDKAPLDRWRLDEVLEGDRKLWGLEQIAACLGVSKDTARKWANDPQSGCPISRPGGQYFAFRSQLMTWLRSA